MWALAIYFYLNLPIIIPIHFNLKGEVDNYGNKYSILFMPLIATVIFFGITFLNKYPHVFNYMKKITSENAIQQYSIATKMLRLLKLSILLIFTIITVSMYLIGTGTIRTLSIWILPVILGLIFIPLAISISKSIKSQS